MPIINPSIYRMILDVQDSVSPYEIHVKEGDTNTRKIEVTLADGGLPFAVPQAANAVMYANDGTETTTCETVIQSDGRLVVALPSTLTESAGEYNCEFTLDSTAGATGYTITTPSFKIIVEPTVVTAS